jgi:hypothetical protein
MRPEGGGGLHKKKRKSTKIIGNPAERDHSEEKESLWDSA